MFLATGPKTPGGSSNNQEQLNQEFHCGYPADGDECRQQRTFSPSPTEEQLRQMHTSPSAPLSNVTGVYPQGGELLGHHPRVL